MIRRTLSLVALSILWSFPAIGQPAFVQSGEHDGFSRLVTRVTSTGAWEVEQVGNKVTLKLDNFRDGFDTSDIFTFIPQDRIRRVEANEDTLTMYLGCDCLISAFDVDGRHVALDIISPTDSAKTNQEATRSPHPEPRPVKIGRQDISNAPYVSPFARTVVNAAETSAMADLQMRLSRELSRGVTRGILNPNTPPPPLRWPHIDAGALPQDTSRAPFDPMLNRTSGNIKISTSMDVPKKPNSDEDTVSDQGLWCPPDDAVNISNWGDDRPYDVQIAASRQNLFGEFDRLNKDAAILLAKQYLFFGFGAEAMQVLSLDESIAVEQRMLFELAQILETAGTASDLSLQSFGDCSGNMALWAFLADTNDTQEGQIQAVEILRALNRLPAHLRQHLAPAISNRFLAHNDAESAKATLRSIERLPDPALPAATLAQAHIDLDAGKLDAGSEKLEAVTETNGSNSPEALLSLVDTRIEAGRAIDAETVGLIAAYAQEYRDTDLEPRLRRALALTMIETRAFDVAQTEIEKIAMSQSPTTAAELNAYLASKLTTAASDIVFLDTVMDQQTSDFSQLDVSTGLLMATRLLDLGFAPKAHEILETIPENPRNTVRQMLSARVALALDQPYQAMADLLGVDDADADILRADAKNMSGAYDEAHALYERVSDRDAAMRSAWLSENWRDLTPVDAPVFGPAARLGATRVEQVQSTSGMLGRTESILDESGQARQTLADLLAASQLPEPGE